MSGNDRTWRQLTVWLHVVSSVGWMALALTLLALLALATTEPGSAPSATAMAHFLDTVLLAPLANTSASTGLVLSLGTAWGLVHQRWVLTKFAITLVQLYAGIFLLSRALDDAATAAEAAPAMVGGTLAMAGALGFQAWLSVTKPWPRTRWARHRRTGRPVRLPTAPPALFAFAVLAPLVDIAVGTFVGFPTPVLSLLSVVAAAVMRQRSLRAPEASGRVQTSPTVPAIGETRP
ncbi:hypothetical protein [Pseudonocardia cypriaca]|uniref:hypothetical protein n=1 Tax=Pseudonocardia cypriaca TaxID=882449 RepID=UPI00114F9616|nr:hypothetical protein [Pseudonocardia cypriaca]